MTTYKYLKYIFRMYKNDLDIQKNYIKRILQSQMRNKKITKTDSRRY